MECLPHLLLLSTACRTYQMSLRDSEKPSLSTPIPLPREGAFLVPIAPGAGPGPMPSHTALKQVSIHACSPEPRGLHVGRDCSSDFPSTCPTPAQNRCLVDAWSILEIHCWHPAEANTYGQCQHRGDSGQTLHSPKVTRHWGGSW